MNEIIYRWHAQRTAQRLRKGLEAASELNSTITPGVNPAEAAYTALAGYVQTAVESLDSLLNTECMPKFTKQPKAVEPSVI